jgi:hypothetical protein
MRTLRINPITRNQFNSSFERSEKIFKIKIVLKMATRISITIGFRRYWFGEEAYKFMKSDLYGKIRLTGTVTIPLGVPSGLDFEVKCFTFPFTEQLKEKLDSAMKDYESIMSKNSNSIIKEIEEQKEERFWMVYLSGGGAPTFRHDSWEAAKIEAARLSRRFEKPAYVLEAKAQVYVEVKVETQVNLLSIPPETEPIHQGFCDYQG